MKKLIFTILPFVICTTVFGQNARKTPLLSTPENYDVTTNIDYVGENNPAQMLDLAVPKVKPSDGSRIPLIVYVHGGGWKGGSKQGGLQLLLPFLHDGRYAAASINYRLTGEAVWPAQIHDCKAAIRWIKAHCDNHQIDPNKIVVWGTSAGGHLVSALGTCGPDDHLEGDLGPFPHVDTKVTGVINYYGPTAFGFYAQLEEKRSDPNGFENLNAILDEPFLKASPERIANISPATFVTSDDCPFLIVNGTDDKLVPLSQAQYLDQVLDQARVPSCLITVNGAGHGFKHGEPIDPIFQTFVDELFQGQTSSLKDHAVDMKTPAPRVRQQ